MPRVFRLAANSVSRLQGSWELVRAEDAVHADGLRHLSHGQRATGVHEQGERVGAEQPGCS
jgi:hypothetical protein